MGSDVVVVPEVDVSRLPESIGQEVTRILGSAQLAAEQIRTGAERDVAELQQKVARLRAGLGAIMEQLRQLEWAEGSAPPEAAAPPAAAAAAEPVAGDEPWPVPAEAPPAEADAGEVETGEDDPEAAEIQARVSGQIGVVEHLRRMAR
jgi:uncharacterized coiled-coil protein SlyX